jgi:hypothetical protein
MSEQDSRRMLVNRLRSVYADQGIGRGVTGGKIKPCPEGYKRVCRKIKTKTKMTKTERNRRARVRYYQKKGYSDAKAENLADGGASSRKGKPCRSGETNKRTGCKPAPPYVRKSNPLSRVGKPCRKGETKKRTGCTPAPPYVKKGDAAKKQWMKEIKYQMKQYPGISSDEAAILAKHARTYGKPAGMGLYGADGHGQYGGVLMDSNYGGVLMDNFYN